MTAAPSSLQVYTDPLQHALIAAAVVAPLGRRAIGTAVSAALAIDVDHAVARGPVYGWAAFAALGSHLLHDAGDRAAPTPLFWPFAPARQLGRRRQLVGTVALALGSVAVSRATAAPSRGRTAPAGGDGGGAAARPRTASARS